jgi:hypothetical protein
MRGLILVLLLCSQASATGLYERYVFYRCGKPYYGYRSAAPLKPNYNTQQVSYHYTVNYNQAAAHQGNTVYGVSDIASFYGDVDFGTLFHQAGRLAEGAQQLSAKATAGYSELLTSTQADRTRVASILAQGQAASQALSAAKPPASATIVTHSSVNAEATVESHPGVSTLEATNRACANCHGAGAESKGGSIHLPKLQDLSAEQAKIAREYITRLDDANCARKANLSHAAQQELLDLLCKKSQ